ncbi:MAG: peptidoglycan DD-metalloendopeptidase family protein [Bacteroidales bacterium]|nr:peptidoglycan DD-metalloendopeptidase family protein [Bacteroidales bacterium]
MKQNILFVTFLLFVLCFRFAAVAQSRDELERNRQNLQREIRLTNELLVETQKTAEVSMSHLAMLNQQIRHREDLLTSLQREVRLINRSIASLNDTISVLEGELEELKSSYADMIKLAARNRDATQRMMFIFSSQNFNQAYLRMRHLQQYGRHRRMQAQRIQEASALLEQQKEALQEERNTQQVMLAQQRTEANALAAEKSSQERTIAELKKREQHLFQQLRQQEQEAQALQDAIRRIIEEERRRALERAEAEGRVARDMFALTPEEQLISDNFAGNRGSLPWPLERGVITSHFGTQPHPVLPGIMISNNGIDISTSEGARARAIFEGRVSRIITVPGGFYAVIIRHGEYLSVYSNLSEVFVTNGQTVRTRDELGVVGTNPREAKTYLHLEIWKGNDKQNPATWIARGQ